MKIIIVGCGKVGQKITERLSNEQDMDITVVDLRHEAVRELINEYDVMGISGSVTSLDILVEAGIKDADILIAVTGSDELNLLTCLMAKKIGNCQTIARVRKPDFNKSIHLLKDDLGLAMVINSEEAAASEIARSLRFPSAIQIDTFAKGRIEILRFRISEASVLDNMRVADINARLNSDVLVCGVNRGDAAYIPGGDFVLKAGDKVSIVASIENVSYFFKKIGIKTNKVKDTIIVGGGEIGYYLAQKLIRAGVEVKIIEKNKDKCESLCTLLPGAVIINGDGTDNRLLLEEGIEYAESFVALTNMDEENILLSLFAKSKTNGKLVTKINRIAYDEVINNLDLDTTIYPKDITAEYIVRFVRAKRNSIGCNIETMHFIMDGKAEALEFRIKENSPVVNIPLEEMNLKENILVACINRGGRIVIPRGRDIIKKDDSVIIVTTHKGFKDIRDILE